MLTEVSGEKFLVTNYANRHSSIIKRLSFCAGSLDLLIVLGAKHMIPKPARDSEIHVRILMMNDVMGAQLSISWILEIEMVMNVMKKSIETESREQRREET